MALKLTKLFYILPAYGESQHARFSYQFPCNYKFVNKTVDMIWFIVTVDMIRFKVLFKSTNIVNKLTCTWKYRSSVGG